ncbi:MAG: single-stranded DNA-binding protein [Bacilli bacterium]|nr:single-stranded DNA-binding protein [Bacilli bacterium]
MLNQIVLVGRLTKEVQINKTENGKKISNITLAVPRSFKNMNGLYDTDFIDCILWENVAVNTSEYCHKGDILGIKGRVQSRIIEKDDKKQNVLEVIAEKVTFLTSKSENSEKQEN